MLTLHDYMSFSSFNGTLQLLRLNEILLLVVVVVVVVIVVVAVVVVVVVH
jgi:hypothetical protein